MRCAKSIEILTGLQGLDKSRNSRITTAFAKTLSRVSNTELYKRGWSPEKFFNDKCSKIRADYIIKSVNTLRGISNYSTISKNDTYGLKEKAILASQPRTRFCFLKSKNKFSMTMESFRNISHETGVALRTAERDLQLLNLKKYIDSHNNGPAHIKLSVLVFKDGSLEGRINNNTETIFQEEHDNVISDFLQMINEYNSHLNAAFLH